MTNPIEKFFDENPIDEKNNYRSVAMIQKNLLIEAAHVLGLDPDLYVEFIGPHRSKSIDLPVVKYHLPNGSFLIVRDNFHNFAVTVESAKPLDVCRLLEVGVEPKTAPPCSCEGFPCDSIFGSVIHNPQKFTSHIFRDEFFLKFVRYFGEVNDARPNSRVPSSEKKPAI
jgi:hypothetical protein